MSKLICVLSVILLFAQHGLLNSVESSAQNNDQSLMDKEWFQTWDRPNYQEWAAAIPEGYLLYIIRKEENCYLVVQAKLIMGTRGLPVFEVIEQHNVRNMQAANDYIQRWKTDQVACSERSL